MSINYDPKHVVKRVPPYFTSDKKGMTVNDDNLNKGHVEMFYFDQNLGSLLNPKDRQNVSLAVKLLQLFKSTPKYQSTNPREKSIEKDFELVGKLMDLLLSFFVNTKISLHDQLINLAILSHLLLFIFRRHKTNFMTKDLYMDIQSTIQDAFVVTSYFKSECPNKRLYLILLGTDQLDMLFSIIRCITHSKNCDFLELFFYSRVFYS